MAIVDFTDDKFDEIKRKNRVVNKKLEALLNHFLNNTTEITSWTCPDALQSAVTWLYMTLQYMKKQNKKKQQTNENLGTCKIYEILDKFKNLDFVWKKKK